MQNYTASDKLLSWEIGRRRFQAIMLLALSNYVSPEETDPNGICSQNCSK